MKKEKINDFANNVSHLLDELGLMLDGVDIKQSIGSKNIEIILRTLERKPQ